MKMTDKELETWNKRNPPGTPCRVLRNDGQWHKTRTRSIAWRLGHDDVVVKLEGISGGYDLDYIEVDNT